jgi:hypothetical protein
MFNFSLRSFKKKINNKGVKKLQGTNVSQLCLREKIGIKN